tara:strand:- start:147 stop:365 length:219 start_codon:yes stop_codon:yes gene_type:complete
MDFLYRKAARFVRSANDKQWLKCTAEGKEKIEKMFPFQYEFKQEKPPEPTPNMIQEKPKAKTEKKKATKNKQ